MFPFRRYLVYIPFIICVVLPAFYPLVSLDFRLSPADGWKSEPLTEGRVIEQNISVNMELLDHSHRFCASTRFSLPKGSVKGIVTLKLISRKSTLSTRHVDLADMRNDAYEAICSDDTNLNDVKVVISSDVKDKASAPMLWLMKDNFLGVLEKYPKKSAQISVGYQVFPFNAWPNMYAGVLYIAIMSFSVFLFIRFGMGHGGRA